MGCVQCEELRAQLSEAERSATELQTVCRRHKQDLEARDAELHSLTQTMAQKTGELVRPCRPADPPARSPVPSMLPNDVLAVLRARAVGSVVE